MVSALKLAYSRPRHVLSYTCTECGVDDSDGMSGPRYLVDHGGGYGYRVQWMCMTCADVAWSAYLSAVRLRRQLIAASRILGWPARRCDLELLSTRGIQMVLL